MTACIIILMDCQKIIEQSKDSIAFILTEDGTGSGFIFQEENILVTCNHVINGSKKIFIKFPDSEYIGVDIIIRDEEHDLALLSFSPDKKRKPLTLAKNLNVREGTPAAFSGYPLGLKNLTTHQGIISGVTKDPVGIVTYSIDGTVNPGNSGCPLMNSNGDVIGIINAMRVESGKLLNKVKEMKVGAMKIHDTDLVEIFQGIIRNIQLGIGYAVPASYIPERKKINGDQPKIEKPENQNNNDEK